MKLLALLVGLLALSSCAATLEHPLTHQRVTCQSGWTLGGGTGIAGAMMLGIAVIGDILWVSEYRKCVNDLKRAGYEEVTPESASNEPGSPIPPLRDSG